MTYNEIIDAIKTVIEEVSDIKEVHDVVPKDMSKYPCAIIKPLGHDNSVASVASNKRQYNFLIPIIGNLEGNSDETQRKIRDLVDEVSKKLEDQDNLHIAGVDDVIPTKVTFRFANEPTELYIGEITYQIKMIVNRNI